MDAAKLALLQSLVALTGGEALFRPSSIDRVIGCPGSVMLSARIPRKKESPSRYALEGSAAHKVAEDALKGIRQPDEWTDRQVVLDWDQGWFVNDEMAENVGFYISEVEARTPPGAQRDIEVRMSLQPLDPTDPLLRENRGTADCRIIDQKQGLLRIMDLKYGKGVPVPADAPQLSDYALMALVSTVGSFDIVETVVVQPRSSDEDQRVKTAQFTPAELFNNFLPKLVGAMEMALDTNAPLSPHPKRCRWCPAAGPDERGQPVCPALADQAMHIARDAFAAVPLLTASSPPVPPPEVVVVQTAGEKMPVPPPGAITLPSPLELDPADVATILERREIYDTFITGVERRAVALLEAGMAVPGWALKARAGNRKFRDPETAQTALRALGLQTSALFTEPVLKSPAQIEKLLPAAKRKELEPLVERPLGAPTLVRATAHGAATPPAAMTPLTSEAAEA